MQTEPSRLRGLEIPASYNEETREKIKLFLDESSINFFNKHQGLFKTDYTTNGYCKNISITLDDLIDNNHQLIPRRLIDFKEGLAHLKLLLSISSEKEIKDFYKKIQNQNILDPDNPNYNAITEILNQNLSNLDNKINSDTQYAGKNLPIVPSLERMENGVINKNKIFPHHIERLPKINLEFMKYLKQVMTDSMKKNFEMLNDAKDEYRYYKEKVAIISGLIKGKLKEKFDIENEVIKINEEYKRIKALKSSLFDRKNELRYLKKKINLYAKYFSHEQKEKAGNAVSKTKLLPETVGKEKIKYRHFLDCFKEQKIDLQNILREIQNFSNKRSKVYIKYSALLRKLSHLENSLKEGNAYKDSLTKEIKSLSCRIKDQKTELQYLNKIIKSYYRLESCLIKESENTKRSLEIQSNIFSRYKNNNNIRLDFNNKFAKDFPEINVEAERLCKQLDVIHQNNKKLLKHADNLSKQLIKNRKRFEKTRNNLPDQISPLQARKLLKEISENRTLLTKLKLDFDKPEKDLNIAKKEKEDKLFSLKEQGENHDLMIGKSKIFIDLCKERICTNEILLTNVYEKLSAMKIGLATTYEKFKISCVCNDELLRTFRNIHEDIESLQKNLLRDVQNGREFLEQEESKLNLHVIEQQGIQKKYKELCGKFEWPCLNREDIEVLLYQNSDLEKKSNDLCLQKSKKYELNVHANGSLYYVENCKNRLWNGSNKIILKNKRFRLMPRLANFEPPSLLKAGTAVFLVLTCFSYLLVYNSDNIYDYKKNLHAFNLLTYDSNEERFKNDLQKISSPMDYKERINLFDENNSEKFLPTAKINTLQNSFLNTSPSSLLLQSKQIDMTEDVAEIEKINAVWSNYAEIFDDLRFNDPLSTFRLFEIMMNMQVLDLTLMDSIQLLYSIKRVLQSEEGPFFDRLFHDFVELGFKKKEAVLNLLYNNRLIEKTYSKNIQYIFKGKILPIAILEKANMKDFEKMIIPYIVTNYKAFARNKNISIPENIDAYAKNLAQDIYICAKKFRVPVTSLLTIAHQESFFINLLGDGGKSASPFQIYKPTKQHILKRLKRDGFKTPVNVSNLENHITLATFMTAYHFAGLIKRYAISIVDPFTHKPTAVIVNLRKSTKSYNGGKPYERNVFLKQLKLERYLKDKMKKIPIAS